MKKTIFIAFAMEDDRPRDFLKGQSLNTNSSFEFHDMSVKEPYASNWKQHVDTRIKNSDGVVVLASKNTLKSSGHNCDILCSKKNNRTILGIWAYADDRTNIDGVNTKTWNWENISNFIDNI